MPAVPGEHVYVLGDYETHVAKARRRASGKERVTLEVKSQLTIADLDPVRLGAAVAVALAEAVATGIRNHGGTVSKATTDFRQNAQAAFARGARWAKKRYAGGKIGAMSPWQSGSQMLNDSGRLAKSIVARLVRGGQSDNEGKWTINVAANRLTQDQPLLRARMLALLAPIIAAATTSQTVEQAITKAGKNAVKVGGKRSLEELLRASLEAAQAARELGGAIDEFGEEPK